MASALAMPGDLMGVKIRCLECWMKLAIGVDITVKGKRVEPSSEWKWDLLRVKVFGKLAMALHMSVDIPYATRYRPELFVRASLLRMIDTKGAYWAKPHGRFPVLSYLGISLVSIFVKLDLTSIVRIGQSSEFRFAAGFRVNDAALEFGFEKIGDASPQLISAANFDGEMMPLDFALNEGSHAYAFAQFGPHLMAWPWVVGTGQIQRIINIIAWGNTIKKTRFLAMPNVNILPAVQIGSRFSYSANQKCVLNSPEFGFSVWIWHEMSTLMSVPRDFYAPARGITYGFSSNFGVEIPLWSTPLADPSCLFSVDLGGVGEANTVCLDHEAKCEARCKARITAKRPVSDVTVCKCQGGSLVMQCTGEKEPHMIHPDGGVGATITADEGSVDDAYKNNGRSAPKIDVAALAPECEKLLSCDACAAHRQCGWCAALERCVPGNDDERPAQCHEGDWLYDTCFRDPALQITNVPASAAWRGGETHTVEWTSRNDVPIARVAVEYRWNSAVDWVLAAVLDSNTGTYELTLPDTLPATEEFQIMVQALPAAPAAASADELPLGTADVLESVGRAYATSPLVRIVAPIACAGFEGEAGRCVSPDTCAASGGRHLYEGRKNPRAGCEEAPDATHIVSFFFFFFCFHFVISSSPFLFCLWFLLIQK